MAFLELESAIRANARSTPSGMSRRKLIWLLLAALPLWPEPGGAVASWGASLLAGRIKFRRVPSYHTRLAKTSWIVVLLATGDFGDTTECSVDWSDYSCPKLMSSMYELAVRRRAVRGPGATRGLLPSWNRVYGAYPTTSSTKHHRQSSPGSNERITGCPASP